MHRAAATIAAARGPSGKIAFSGREHMVAVAPAQGRGRMAYTLRYQSELGDQRERDIKDAEINEDSLESAKALIAKRASKFQ
jgi:non-homologous end joining protein Ku